MTLQREVPRRYPDRGRVIGRLLVGTFVAIAFSGFVIGPRVMKMFGESKAEIAVATIKKYAYDAYPAWRTAHPDERCPARLILLNDYMTNKDIIDPWGSEYELYCGPGGIIVHSRGEDAVGNTQDDLWSNQ